MNIQELLALREGKKTKVYKDSLGKLTGGIGHLLTPEDLKKFKLGDSISEDQVTAWFNKDVAHAKDTAEKQATELGITDEWAKTVLISVNFQLGDFKAKFPDTYKVILNKNYTQAIKNLQASAWNKQTPVRVKDFTDVLGKL
jgi:GH24 family phage-related lysozyme (muramidase)